MAQQNKKPSFPRIEAFFNGFDYVVRRIDRGITKAENLILRIALFLLLIFDLLLKLMASK